MERLTEHHVNKTLGAYMVCSGACIDDNFDCNGCKKLEEMVDRLAAYEDTGLEPCDYSAMRAAINQVQEFKKQLSDVVNILAFSDIEHLKDIFKAEKDGRLVVLLDRQKMLEHCPMRHPDNGNCVAAGGFCRPDTEICKALHVAYEQGLFNAHEEAEATLKKSKEDL